MKKYSKLIIAAIIALIFIGTFVFLWQKSQPKEVVYNEFTPKQDSIQKTTIIRNRTVSRRPPSSPVRSNPVTRSTSNRRSLVSSPNSTRNPATM